MVNIEEIEANSKKRFAGAIVKIAHKLKSWARSVVANKLTNLCQLLEALGKMKAGR